MGKKHILLVDDNNLLCRSLSFHLNESGYQVNLANSAEEALEILRHNKIDLIILDIVLPGIDGLEALRRIRQEHQIPVIFLTGRRRELDELLALELGGDDYVTKPFDVDLLLARIKAVLRRASLPAGNLNGPSPIHAGDLSIDPVTHEVKIAEREVELQPLEFQLLYTLASEPGRSFTVQELLDRVWGLEFQGEPQVVYVHMGNLREKIEENPRNPKRVITDRGLGYRLEPHFG